MVYFHRRSCDSVEISVPSCKRRWEEKSTTKKHGIKTAQYWSQLSAHDVPPNKKNSPPIQKSQKNTPWNYILAYKNCQKIIHCNTKIPPKLLPRSTKIPEKFPLPCKGLQKKFPKKTIISRSLGIRIVSNRIPFWRRKKDVKVLGEILILLNSARATNFLAKNTHTGSIIWGGTLVWDSLCYGRWCDLLLATEKGIGHFIVKTQLAECFSSVQFQNLFKFKNKNDKGPAHYPAWD